MADMSLWARKVLWMLRMLWSVEFRDLKLWAAAEVRRVGRPRGKVDVFEARAQIRLQSVKFVCNQTPQKCFSAPARLLEKVGWLGAWEECATADAACRLGSLSCRCESPARREQ